MFSLHTTTKAPVTPQALLICAFTFPLFTYTMYTIEETIGQTAMTQQKTLTTTEARAYVDLHTGKQGRPRHIQQWNRWQRKEWITPYIGGTRGKQNIYTIEAVDRLVARINKGYKGNWKTLTNP